MSNRSSTAYRIATGLFLVGVVGQVLLAGIGVFATAWGFVVHTYWGAVLYILMLGMWALAIQSKQASKITRLNSLLALAFTVQGGLPHLRDIVPLAAAFHPVNALLIFWLAVTLAREAQAFVWLRRLPIPKVTQQVDRRPVLSSKH